MPAVGRGTSGINNYDVNWFQGVINNLRANFVANGYITASDMNTLIYLWNVFNDHAHNVSDLYGIWDYGDGLGNPGYSGSGNYEADGLYGPSNLWGDIGGVGAGDIIYASKQNELAGALGGGANHYHGWDDRSA